jgi:glycine/D-amino acid oxidase-like deaminating enzyme
VRQVPVVGAGIVGACVAFHLARQGEGVTVLDTTQPGAGATRHSFAWMGDGGDDRTGCAGALHRQVPY